MSTTSITPTTDPQELVATAVAAIPGFTDIERAIDALGTARTAALDASTLGTPRATLVADLVASLTAGENLPADWVDRAEAATRVGARQHAAVTVGLELHTRLTGDRDALLVAKVETALDVLREHLADVLEHAPAAVAGIGDSRTADDVLGDADAGAALLAARELGQRYAAIRAAQRTLVGRVALADDYRMADPESRARWGDREPVDAASAFGHFTRPGTPALVAPDAVALLVALVELVNRQPEEDEDPVEAVVVPYLDVRQRALDVLEQAAKARRDAQPEPRFYDRRIDSPRVAPRRTGSPVLPLGVAPTPVPR